MPKFLIVITLLSIGTVAGYLLKEAQAPTPSTPAMAEGPLASAGNPFADTSIVEELVRLRQALSDEVAARHRLEDAVEELRRRAAAVSDTGQGRTDNRGRDVPVQRPAVGNPPAVLDEQTALTNAGLDSVAHQRIEQRLQQAEMARLYLRDRAVREGWVGTERYAAELRGLESRSQVLRSELGDTAYDRFLYDTGGDNRVVVRGVLDGSPALRAGIVEGDIIGRYDGKPIYSWSDLTEATTRGAPGQTVDLEIQRNGSTLTVYVPRGPLGVRLGGSRVAP